MWWLGLHGFDAVEDGLAHDEHSWAAAERFVVNLSTFAWSIIAEVVQLDADETTIDGFFEMSLPQIAVEHFRKQGEDIELHEVLRHRFRP